MAALASECIGIAGEKSSPWLVKRSRKEEALRWRDWSESAAFGGG